MSQLREILAQRSNGAGNAQTQIAQAQEGPRLTQDMFALPPLAELMMLGPYDDFGRFCQND